MDNKDNLSTAIAQKLDRFFEMHDGETPESGLYNRIMSEVEKVLIKKTMDNVDNVQVRASKILGINRNTLRKKLKELKI